jgi:hypothetical protein
LFRRCAAKNRRGPILDLSIQRFHDDADLIADRLRSHGGHIQIGITREVARHDPNL